MKTDLQLQAIVEGIVTVWVPREGNRLADYLSKFTDVDDWGIQLRIFQWINTISGEPKDSFRKN